jgi:hypothetical protein
MDNMNAFLYYVATDIFTKFDGDFRNLTVVFPNRRSSQYFLKYLSKQSDKTILSPEIKTISELVSDYSEKVLGNRILLLGYLYNSYVKIRKSNQSFDDFYFWGEMMLNDFDEIDKYLVDARKIFINLSEIKEFEKIFPSFEPEQIQAINSFWNTFNDGKYSLHQNDFLDIWNCLYDIYEDFNSELDKIGLAYEGKIYKDALNRLRNDFKPNDDLSYAFVGFNALNKCELDFFTLFNSKKKYPLLLGL